MRYKLTLVDEDNFDVADFRINAKCKLPSEVDDSDFLVLRGQIRTLGSRSAGKNIGGAIVKAIADYEKWEL